MHDSFCGWYFKCQSDTQTLAVIPAVHQWDGRRAASIQLITDDGAWSVPVDPKQFHKRRGKFQITAGESEFGEDGIRLRLRTPELSAVGDLRFGEFSPIRYHIMGPFRYVPFLECRHSVQSMKHTVTGDLQINGKPYRFRNSTGYTEGDRGRSFPQKYLWTQCNFGENSLMLSVAEIPFGPIRFTGVIGVVLWQGREYRLATYLGARAVKIGRGEAVIRQGDSVLSVRLMEKHAHPLLAPAGGIMNRTIHESAASTAAYCFQQKGKTIFNLQTPKASFEYEYPD